MELLPFEEVERVAGAKLELQQQYVSGALNYPYMRNVWNLISFNELTDVLICSTQLPVELY